MGIDEVYNINIFLLNFYIKFNYVYWFYISDFFKIMYMYFYIIVKNNRKYMLIVYGVNKK